VRITCTVRLRIDGSLRDDGVRVLRGLLGPVRSERGCLQTRLLQDTADDDDRVTWVSSWRQQSNLERHLRSLHFRRILAVMELASEAPVVEIEIDGEIRGFDLIEEVLAASGAPHESAISNQPSTKTR